MMPTPAAANNPQLLQVLNAGGAAHSIDDVVGTMQAIDNLLPSADGLKWFNLLYLTVTQKVDSAVAAQQWKDSAWVARLDVVFAQFYFRAISNWLQSSTNV